MALTLGDNFSYLGTKPLDGRIKYSTIAEMVAMSDTTLYDGIMAYCVEDGKNYQYKSTNEVDATLGKWREFSSGGGAVDSVNGKTGVVVLDAEDVGALPDDTDIIDGASYDSVNHLILFKQGSTTLFSLDAAAFVKDGMVDTVSITGGNLVITFNTDAGKQDISIPLTDIFNPNNYYDKTATDGLLANKADASDVDDIEALIPSTATTSNKLATMGDVIDDFDDITNRPQESDAIDISQLDLPMPAKPTEYPVLFDETGTEYKVGLYKRADGKVKPVYKKTFDLGSQTVVSNNGWFNTGIAYSNIEMVYNCIGCNIDTTRVDSLSSPFLITQYNNSGTWHIQASRHDGAVAIRYFIIEFTKTTDEWKEV